MAVVYSTLEPAFNVGVETVSAPVSFRAAVLVKAPVTVRFFPFKSKVP